MTGKPKLTRALPITWGAQTKTLPVVRVVVTVKAPRPIALSDPGPPFSMVASEQVEIVVRGAVGDFVDVLPGPGAESIPYAKVRLGEQTVDAIVKHAGEDLRVDDVTWLFRLLLLRIPLTALDADDEWERDDDYCYSHDGVEVMAVKPKPRLDAEVYVGEPGGEGWRYVGTSESGITWGRR